MLDDKPCRKPVREQELWDEMLLYVADREVALALNSSARAVWELCDGTRTVAEMCHELGRRFDCAGADLLADVAAAVSRFRDLGLLVAGETAHAPVPA
jgi:hypothetical protein